MRLSASMIRLAVASSTSSQTTGTEVIPSACAAYQEWWPVMIVPVDRCAVIGL